MDRRAFTSAVGSAACTRPAAVHANTDRDGIVYMARGGYDALDHAASGTLRGHLRSYPVVGNNFWGMHDQPVERTGWGLFSYNDKPYDGRNHRVAQPDPYTAGRTTLTEVRVYGYAITPIRQAHIEQFTTLSRPSSGATYCNFEIRLGP